MEYVSILLNASAQVHSLEWSIFSSEADAEAARETAAIDSAIRICAPTCWAATRTPSLQYQPFSGNGGKALHIGWHQGRATFSWQTSTSHPSIKDMHCNAHFSRGLSVASIR
jgi:hypothetical protein